MPAAHLPKEGPLEDELHVVARPAVELEVHVLRAAVEDLDVEVPHVAAHAAAPAHRGPGLETRNPVEVRVGKSTPIVNFLDTILFCKE